MTTRLTFRQPAAADGHLTFAGAADGTSTVIIRAGITRFRPELTLAQVTPVEIAATITRFRPAVLAQVDVGRPALVSAGLDQPVGAGVALAREYSDAVGQGACAVAALSHAAGQGQAVGVGAPQRLARVPVVGPPGVTQAAGRALPVAVVSGQRAGTAPTLRPRAVHQRLAGALQVLRAAGMPLSDGAGIEQGAALAVRGGQLVLLLGGQALSDGLVVEAHGSPLGHPTEPVPTPCYLPSGHLTYSRPAALDGHLTFTCESHDQSPDAAIVVPVRRAYIVLNTATLVHLASGTVIPCARLSMSLDVDSWAWSVTAVIDQASVPLMHPVDGEPSVLQAVINGIPLRWVVTGVSRAREFGSTAVSVRGSSRTALLESPYSPVTSVAPATDRTAAQLVGDVLSANGVSLGWDVDWRLEDWLVPAGAWAYQGTYIQGAAAIAAAAGAVLQPHMTDDTLIVMPRYPVAPWDWADTEPDIEIPAAAARVESMDWVTRPDYNAVFVSGAAGGVLCHVTRSGTAGDLVAQMVTDALVTAPAAGVQRGRAILADTGRQAQVQIKLLVLPETGIIVPGQLLRYIDADGRARVGLTRSVALDVTHGVAWQTVGVETHGND